MEKHKLLLFSLVSGITASVLWLIADILLVGFSVNPDQYPIFAVKYADRVDLFLAVSMLPGSSQRLMWGVMIAVFSTPLYIYALYFLWKIMEPAPKRFSIPVILSFIALFACHPLAHASFFYVGEIYKTILHTPVSSHPVLLDTADGFVRMLYINWFAFFILFVLCWLGLGILVATGKTRFPSGMFWINPVAFIIGIIALIFILPQSMQTWVKGAIFSEANLIFWLISFFYIFLYKTNRKNLQKAEG